MLSYGGARNPRFPTPMEDDAAIATAFLAVISSSPSSPSARPAPQRAALGSKGMAFGRYNSSPAPLGDPDSCYPRQRMIKRALAIMRQIGSTKAYTRTQESPRPVATQFHHLMTERKRREKLNESFAVLRTLLSPDTRKDRVSVLAGTRDCMNAMREQISCLEEKNRALEAHLTAPEDPTDEAESSGERVEIRVNRMPESSSSQLGHQIELRVTVRVKCDAVGLLLRVLRRLKEMGSLSVVSMEARGFSRHGNPFGRAILKIQIEVGEWDEAAFMEAVTSAVDDGLAAPR
ncbi:unnamed protein product [Spirodela intermedia]|uniref:BHLH domain-containing protein n=1 Tax=Spirodela intermedia TaxID=51605 RepID=A0A7I8KYM9_SPIIN|nr:unnamed protein product [Spirodela intermedia]